MNPEFLNVLAAGGNLSMIAVSFMLALHHGRIGRLENDVKNLVNKLLDKMG